MLRQSGSRISEPGAAKQKALGATRSFYDETHSARIWHSRATAAHSSFSDSALKPRHLRCTARLATLCAELMFALSLGTNWRGARPTRMLRSSAATRHGSATLRHPCREVDSPPRNDRG